MSNCHNDKKIIIESLEKIVSTLTNENNMKLHNSYNVINGSNWIVEDRCKNDLFALFMRNGTAKSIINGVEECLHKNQIVFISNDITHSFYADSKEIPSFISVHFGIYSDESNTSSNESYTSSNNRITEPFSFTFQPDNIEKFKMIFEDISNYSRKTNPEFSYLPNYLLNYLFAEILQHFRTKNFHNSYIEKKISTIKEKIDMNPTTPWTIEQMAASIGISRKYFSRIFKAYYGLTPKEYQIISRIHYARYLLEEKCLSIKETSMICSYPDQYSFSKQFKEIFGFSPVKLRKYNDDYFMKDEYDFSQGIRGRFYNPTKKTTTIR